MLEIKTPLMYRTIQNSVFCSLFGQPRYQYELYRILMPNDTSVKQEDLALVNVKPLEVNDDVNDLCLLTKNNFLILVETESDQLNVQWLAVRLLTTFADTYKKCFYPIVYGSDDIQFKYPTANLFLFFTDEKSKAKNFNLKDKGLAIGMDVNVVTGPSQKDKNLVYQFHRFCEIAKKSSALSF